jgi:hypothetical protein
MGMENGKIPQGNVLRLCKLRYEKNDEERMIYLNLSYHI